MGIQNKPRFVILSAFAGVALTVCGVHALRADDAPAEAVYVADTPELMVEHADCTLFGAGREKFARQARERFALSAATDQVMRMMSTGAGALPPAPGGSRTGAYSQLESGNLIDKYTFAAMRSAGVSPADKTTDVEFIRRVSLDLTGRIPTPERLLAFLNDSSPNKRAALVDELLAKSEWVDKWTMYLGDRFKNTDRRISSGITMFGDGRLAFYQWIKDSLANGKPYSQMASEIIAAKGTNSYDPAQGPINWTVGGIVSGGPQQDIWDQQTANIAETFLGMAHVNCVLCHNGRGHLDSLSLWGRNTTRYQAWQLSAFLSKTTETRAYPDPINRNLYYWAINDLPRNPDYALNTTTGNRPARQPMSGQRNVAPVYIFTGEKPAADENYRDALARFVTNDPQFARAAVNYMWKEFFGRGIVDPVNQFDPARLDANNPPPDPWAVQPANPQLLAALAQDFAANGFSLKYLMKLITTSETYQLSSRYSGQWNPLWEPLFARKLVRRLWGEEVLDALAQASGMQPTYNIPLLGKINWAMQAPEPKLIGGNVLNSFLPGNRDDQERRSDGAVQQGLSMMNDATIMARTRAAGSGAAANLLARYLGGTDDNLVTNLYLNVLSRYPGDAEKATAIAALRSGNRQQKAEDLLWSLYNKVDFLFNY